MSNNEEKSIMFSLGSGEIHQNMFITLNEGNSIGTMPDLAQYLMDIGTKRDRSAAYQQRAELNAATGSYCITDEDENGTLMQIYVHAPIPSFKANPDLERVITQKLSAPWIERDKFLDLLLMDGETDQEGNRLVWVVPGKEVTQYANDSFTSFEAIESVDKDQALKAPNLIQFFGSKKVAETYIDKILEGKVDMRYLLNRPHKGIQFLGLDFGQPRFGYGFAETFSAFYDNSKTEQPNLCFHNFTRTI